MMAWIVEKKNDNIWIPFFIAESRSIGRGFAKYYNGFSHGTKKAKYRVKKYTLIQ